MSKGEQIRLELGIALKIVSKRLDGDCFVQPAAPQSQQFEDGSRLRWRSDQGVSPRPAPWSRTQSGEQAAPSDSTIAGDGTKAQCAAAVEVPPIQGKAGWLVRNALNDRLGQSGSQGAPRYRLDVLLDDQLEGLGLISDDTIGRERRTLRARYQLIDIASGEIVLDASAGSDAGIDVVSSEYATIAAENTALENLSKEVADRIVARLALALRAPKS